MDLNSIKQEHKSLLEQWRRVRNEIESLQQKEEALVRQEKDILDKIERLIEEKIESFFQELSKRQEKK